MSARAAFGFMSNRSFVNMGTIRQIYLDITENALIMGGSYPRYASVHDSILWTAYSDTTEIQSVFRNYTSINTNDYTNHIIEFYREGTWSIAQSIIYEFSGETFEKITNFKIIRAGLNVLWTNIQDDLTNKVFYADVLLDGINNTYSIERIYDENDEDVSDEYIVSNMLSPISSFYYLPGISSIQRQSIPSQMTIWDKIKYFSKTESDNPIFNADDIRYVSGNTSLRCAGIYPIINLVLSFPTKYLKYSLDSVVWNGPYTIDEITTDSNYTNNNPDNTYVFYRINAEDMDRLSSSLQYSIQISDTESFTRTITFTPFQ